MPQARGTHFVVTKTDGAIQSYADHVFRSCSPSWFRNSNLIKDSKPGRQYAKACVEDGRYGVARIVFGAEPSDEEILRFVASKWEKLSFFGDEATETSKPAKNPKRRAREAAKALKRPAMSTKAQQALVAQREAMKQESAHARSRRRAGEAEARFEQRKLKRKQKHRGH